MTFTFVSRVATTPPVLVTVAEAAVCGWCSGVVEHGLDYVNAPDRAIVARELSALAAALGGREIVLELVQDDARALTPRDCAMCGHYRAGWPVDVDVYA